MKPAMHSLVVDAPRRIAAFEGTLRLLAAVPSIGGPIVNLGIGTSHYPLSNDIESFSFQLRDLISYGPAAGDDVLRRRVCDLVRWLHPGADVAPERIVITDGGSNALYLALLCLVRPGRDVVLMPEVHYPSFRPLLDVTGASARLWKLDERARPVWSSVREAISNRTAAILVDSPSNPFAVQLTESELAELASLGVPIVSDEVYSGIGSSTSTSIVTHTGDHFMVGSFSKLFAMPGLRLGYLVAPEWAVDIVRKMRFALNIATAIPSQRLGMLLIEQADRVIPKHREYMQVRRERAIELCRETGLPLVNDGAGEGFYVCADIRALGMSSIEFAEKLLQVAKVTVCPGSDFVAQGDPGFVRMNLAVDLSTLESGFGLVSDFYGDLLQGTSEARFSRGLGPRLDWR